MIRRLPFLHAVRLLIGLAAAFVGSAADAGKLTVYASLPADQEAALPGIRQAFGDRFTITPVGSREDFVPAKVPSPTHHPYIRNVGRVTLAAVADVDGRLRDPIVVESTNPRLNLMLRNSMKNWRCVPARLGGAPVPSVVTRTVEIKFRQPVRIF